MDRSPFNIDKNASDYTYPEHVPHSSNKPADKGRKRGERNSIWPEGKTAKPGRMG